MKSNKRYILHPGHIFFNGRMVYFSANEIIKYYNLPAENCIVINNLSEINLYGEIEHYYPPNVNNST